MIERDEINLICDIINKLIIQKNYKDNIKYFELAIKTNIYDIVEILVKNKINIKDEEFNILNTVKNLSKVLKLLINHNYGPQIIDYFIVRGNITLMCDNFIKVFLEQIKDKATTNILYKIITKTKDIKLVEFIITECKFSSKIKIKDLFNWYRLATKLEDNKIRIIKYLMTNNLLDITDFSYVRTFEINNLLKLLLNSYKTEITDDILTKIIIYSEDINIINYILTEFKYNKKMNIGLLTKSGNINEKLKLLINNDILDINEEIKNLIIGDDIINLLLNKYKNNLYLLSYLFIHMYNMEVIKNVILDSKLTSMDIKNIIVKGRLLHFTNSLFNDITISKINLEKIKLLLDNNILNINDLIDCFIKDVLENEWKDYEISTCLNLLLKINDNVNIKDEKLKEYQKNFKNKEIGYIYNDIINIINKRANKNYELLKLKTQTTA
ncbi:MAG: hypothetical protein QW478_00895 [Candidatus Micrarchaeaceae archaeon]